MQLLHFTAGGGGFGEHVRLQTLLNPDPFLKSWVLSHLFACFVNADNRINILCNGQIG